MTHNELVNVFCGVILAAAVLIVFFPRICGINGWLADRILSSLQRRCKHPGDLVAVDILNGDAASIGIAVRYCGRCGAWCRDRVSREPSDPVWRGPDPNLWRGR